MTPSTFNHRHSEAIQPLWPAWNVALLCEDAQTSERAHWLINAVLPALGMCVKCHVRQWSFSELKGFEAYEAAVDHAFDSDVVILAVHGNGPLPGLVRALCSEWLARSVGSACPLVVTFDPSTEGAAVCNEIVADLQRLCDQARVPSFTVFSDALLVAWDLWRWKLERHGQNACATGGFDAQLVDA